MSKQSKMSQKRPLNSDQLGQTGQTKFGELCDISGLNATDSNRRDRMGWDYLVEIPMSTSRSDEPFDSRHKFPDCKIQVKTIWAENKSVSVNLSALERLARWDYASFLVVLRMNNDKSYSEINVIHLFNENLEKILKALRNIEAQNGRSIKDKTISFTLDPKNSIDVNGDILAATIKSAIGDDWKNYTNEKRDQLKKLGFSTNRFELSVELSDRNIEDVLDVFLGKKEAQVESFKVNETRFGIPIAIKHGNNAKIEIKPQSIGKCQLNFTSKFTLKKAIHPADVFTSQPWGPNGPSKFLASSSFLEFAAFLNQSSKNYTLSLTYGTANTIDEWILNERTYFILAKPPVKFSIFAQNKEVFKSNIDETLTPEKPEFYQRRLEILSEFRDLLEQNGILSLPISLGDIQKNWIVIQFYISLIRPENEFSTTLTIEPAIKLAEKDIESLESSSESIFAFNMDFSGTFIGFWARTNVVVSQNGSNFNFECSNFILRDSTVVANEEDFVAWVTEASISTGIGLILRSGDIFVRS